MALSAKVQAPSVASCSSRNVVSAFQPAGARPQQKRAVVARVAEVCVGHARPRLIDGAGALDVSWGSSKSKRSFRAMQSGRPSN
jgi:hypothetical protein